MTLSDREILDLNELCDVLVEGTATGAQRARLEQLLSESDNARKYYVQASDLSASLSHYAGEMQMEDADAPASRRRIVLFNVTKYGVMAAAIALALGWWTFHNPDKLGKKRATPSSPPEYVARVTGSKDAAWATDSATTATGGFVRRGQRLNLTSGFAELTFDSGAVVLMQGPAVLDVNSAWDSRLRNGTIRANVPPQALGFRVVNSAVEVVDLGTAFSMVAPSEGSADVFVLQGEVEATPRGAEDSETVLLRANDSRRFARPSNNRTERAGQAVEKFSLDVALDRVRQPVKFIQWSFDTIQGRSVPPVAVHGFSSGNYDFHISAHSPAARLAAHSDGFRDHALHFDDNITVKAQFPGLSGNFARTIAFWVRVPRNAPLSAAYSMVAWQGDNVKLGSRPVHIAWNRHPEEGALGALRTDFSGGHAMGTTPLRDGKWHYITVIFLPGEDPSLPVQVKQYVDGRLESNSVTPGAKRSIGANTKSSENSANSDLLWLGCRLGGNGAKSERFSGQIDELTVVDRGLEPAEIVHLMDGKSVDSALHMNSTK